MARLTVQGGPDQGRVFVLQGPGVRWRIGRHPMFQVHLTDRTVAAHHAEVRHEDDAYHLQDMRDNHYGNYLSGEDLSAPPGTTLNGARVPMGTRVRLNAGDVIGIGETTLLFEA